jgi:ribose transport system substrate-binding protein
MQHRRDFLQSLVALTALACTKNKDAPGGSADNGELRVAIIPKGTTHEFWKSVHAGGVKGAQEYKVDLVWKGPLKEDDLKAQIEVVQSFVAQRVAGIVLAPLSDKALKNPVRAAVAAGIPVVVFDSSLAGNAHSSFVATDNRAAGALAGKHMAKILGGKGKVVVLRYQEGSASTMNRERGFLEAVRKAGGLQIVSDNQYGGATTESAFATSESLLGAHSAASGGIDGVFTPNESTTFGMLLALRKNNLAGKIRFVGFDASDKLIGGLEQGHLDALVLQNPFNMGYLAVKTIAAVLRKQPFEKNIDTGSTLVTLENLASPTVQALIHPDLKRWLGE